jgi:hypothetical protein
MSLEPSLQTELLAYLGQLGHEDQVRVVDFARTLTGSSGRKIRGVPGKELLRIIGLIPHEDLEEMKQSIEDACERIDADEW